MLNTFFLIFASVLFLALAGKYVYDITKKHLKNRWFIAPIFLLAVMAIALFLEVSYVFALGIFIYPIDGKLKSMDEKEAKAERIRQREVQYRQNEEK